MFCRFGPAYPIHDKMDMVSGPALEAITRPAQRWLCIHIMEHAAAGTSASTRYIWVLPARTAEIACFLPVLHGNSHHLPAEQY